MLTSLHLDLEKIPILTRLDTEKLGLQNVQISLLRLDLLHPTLSGNKWYKLRHHLETFFNSNKTSIVSFGGAHSNHLHALSFACWRLKIPLKLMVRGDAPSVDKLSDTLKDCLAWGADIKWVNREQYRKRNEPAYLAGLFGGDSGVYIIQEGGSGTYGALGIEELIRTYEEDSSERADTWVCPVGTGTTFAGVINAVDSDAFCIGVSAVKNDRSLLDRISGTLKNERKNWRLIEEYHFGGFAKVPDHLVDFCKQFYADHRIFLDPIYTSKMMWAVIDLLKSGSLGNANNIVLLHTGGLQGWRGIDLDWWRFLSTQHN